MSAEEIAAIAEEVDRHWMYLQRDTDTPGFVACSCGEWQWDFDGPAPLSLGDHFQPFSDHVAESLSAALADAGLAIAPADVVADGEALARLTDSVAWTLRGGPDGSATEAWNTQSGAVGSGDSIRAAITDALADAGLAIVPVVRWGKFYDDYERGTWALNRIDKDDFIVGEPIVDGLTGSQADAILAAHEADR